MDEKVCWGVVKKMLSKIELAQRKVVLNDLSIWKHFSAHLKDVISIIHNEEVVEPDSKWIRAT